MTGAVILAAGQGSRLGGIAKALLRHDGRTFLDTIVTRGRACGVDQWLVVTGAPHREAVGAAAHRLCVQSVVNPDPSRGMASSVAVGFESALQRFDADAAFLWPVDHWNIAEPTLQRLIAAAGPGQVVIPRHDGRGGHPPLVGRELWADLASCATSPDGARGVFRAHASLVRSIEVPDPGVVADVDVPEQLP